MITVRPVIFILGLLVAALGVAMLVPLAVDLAAGRYDWSGFLISFFMAEALGGLLAFGSAGGPMELSLRQGFLLTTGAWMALTAVGALPLVFSEIHLSYTDAVFETISGLTTTGSTVLTGLDSMPPGVLLWRAMLQWFGGVGIIVMGIAMLPYLRVGGMQLFRMESSDRSEKVLPRAAQLAGATSLAYFVLSVACAVSYFLAGMTWFEAIIHAMTTVSTGGYSTSDASIGHFHSSPIEWTATVFMALGALPFVVYFPLARGRFSTIWQNSQVRVFIAGLVVVVLGVALWLWTADGFALMDALRLSAFHVTSIVTTTGYVSDNYQRWGGFAFGVFFFLSFIGGCTGSTAGGLKVLRFELFARVIRTQARRLTQPHGVFPMSYGGRALSEDVTTSAMNFVFVFFAAFCLLTLALAATGLDFTTAASGAITALSNVGPGLGDRVGPAGNFSTLPDTAKWLLSLGMMLGRLEFFTVLVLLTPAFWRG